MPSFSHQCCYWKGEEHDGWAQAHQRIHEMSKEQEAGRSSLEMLDRRDKVQEPPWQKYFDVGICQSFDELGRQLFRGIWEFIPCLNGYEDICKDR